MGRYYALADGEAPEVAEAIREHYLPRGAGDALPTTIAGLALAHRRQARHAGRDLRHRAETRRGTKDPFGLRRAAHRGAAHPHRAPAGSRICRAFDRARRPRCSRCTARSAAAEHEIYDYIMERLRAYYLEGAGRPSRAAICTEMFDAVLATRPRSPLDFDARLKALAAFLELPEAASLTAANKRIANILRKAEGAPARDVDVELLREHAEVRLFDAMRALRDAVATATAQREYAARSGTSPSCAGGRCVLRSGDGDGPGPEAAGQSPGAARASCRGSSPASPTCHDCRVEHGRMQSRRLGRSSRCLPFLWTFFYAIFFVIACRFLPFRRALRAGARLGGRAAAALKWTCRPRLPRRGLREHAARATTSRSGSTPRPGKRSRWR